MIGRVLNAHPDIYCENEFLNHIRDRTRAQKVDYLRAFYYGDAAPDAARDAALFGGTMNPFKYDLTACDLMPLVSPHNAGRPCWWHALFQGKRRGHFKVILLERTNLLKAAVSVYLVHQRGNWASSLHEIDDRASLKKQPFDGAELERIVVRRKRQGLKLKAFASMLSRDHLTVAYEDILDARQDVVNTIFSFLGAPPPPASFDYAAGFVKITSDNLRDVIENYDDLRRFKHLRRYLEG